MKSIYDSMNNYFDDKLAVAEQKSKLVESVEKPMVEFEELIIPAPFDTYYRIIRPEEYEDILGYEYNAAEMEDLAKEADVESLQYAILKDNFSTNGEVEVVAICKDADQIFVGIDLGGRIYPADFDEVKAQLETVEKPVVETAEDSAVESAEEAAAGVVEESLNEELNPWEKLVKAYPELAEEPLREAKRKDPEEEDLWDRVYGDLTMDGELVPSSTGKSSKFNTGAGYSYSDQVWAGQDGEICVGADTLEELKAAAEVAAKYADKGVSYNLRKGSPNRDKFPFIIEISVPYEEE